MGDGNGNGVKASGWNRALPERPETLMAKRAAAPALSAATLSPATTGGAASAPTLAISVRIIPPLVFR